MAADSDSPLSAISSVTGILTFVAAIAAALWVYLQVIQNADGEIRSLVSFVEWHVYSRRES